MIAAPWSVVLAVLVVALIARYALVASSTILDQLRSRRRIRRRLEALRRRP